MCQYFVCKYLYVWYVRLKMAASSVIAEAILEDEIADI